MLLGWLLDGYHSHRRVVSSRIELHLHMELAPNPYFLKLIVHHGGLGVGPMVTIVMNHYPSQLEHVLIDSQLKFEANCLCCHEVTASGVLAPLEPASSIW